MMTKQLPVEDYLPKFRTYENFFSLLGGDFTTIRLQPQEKRPLVDLIGLLHGQPKECFTRTIREWQTTAQVREVRDYANGIRYVRFDVQSLGYDCYFDDPVQLMLAVSRDEVMAYTLIHEDGQRPDSLDGILWRNRELDYSTRSDEIIEWLDGLPEGIIIYVSGKIAEINGIESVSVRRVGCEWLLSWYMCEPP